MKRNILDINGLKVGQTENVNAKTGVTVVLAENGAVCGVDVRGAAPGTRETDLLDPVNAMEKVQAVVLSGGSAFGLEAASGV
ncbi:MAG: P1 family peptidase, partial [Anaerotignum sp.]|nr:P1 family peptidase [Anaerotignum sp.]